MDQPYGDLTALPATRLVELIGRREVSARDVATAFLDRIATHDAALGAIVHLNAERMLAAADEADTASARRSRGPLHGLLIGVKDIIDVAGTPTTGGSLVPATQPRADSELVARLRRAGAILAGKLTTSEFGCGSPFVLRQPRNPWNRRHVAGGSSAGSAIAVAARMLPATIGGDTGGSIRIPASFCGIVGLRPTIGAVPLGGSIELARGIDTAGPMTSTAGDAELLLRVIAPQLGLIAPSAVTTVAYLEPAGSDDPEVATTVATVSRRIARELAVDYRSASSRLIEHAWAGAWVSIYRRALIVHRRRLRDHFGELSRPLRWKLCAAAALAADDLTAAARIVDAARDDLSRRADAHTIVVAPSTSHPANPVDRAYGGRDTMSWTAAASLAGLPALSLPCGLTRAGLPVGVQLMAAPTADFDLLRLAQRLESAGVVGGLGVPSAPSTPDDGEPAPPVEAPPSAFVAGAEVAAVRVAARAIGLPALDETIADGAAKTLQAVREGLHRGSRA